MKKIRDQEKKAMNLVMGSLLALAVIIMAGLPVVTSLLPY